MADGIESLPDLSPLAIEATLLSSRAELERFVAPGSAVDENAAQAYLRETFNTTSTNPMTLDMVQVRVRYIISAICTVSEFSSFG